MIELRILAIILHFIEVQAQNMTPLYAVLISLASLVASGMVHFGVYIWRDGKKAQEMEILKSDVRNLQADMRFVRDRILIMRGKINGET